MEQYLGVKLVNAESLTAERALVNGLLRDSVKFKRDDEGYVIVYEDGYTSWSPKDVFEKAYRKIRNIDDIENIEVKEDYQIRVKNEAYELYDKKEKLSDFLRIKKIKDKIGTKEYDRLNQQLLAMQYYLNILIERIENF